MKLFQFFIKLYQIYSNHTLIKNTLQYFIPILFFGKFKVQSFNMKHYKIITIVLGLSLFPTLSYTNNNLNKDENATTTATLLENKLDTLLALLRVKPTDLSKEEEEKLEKELLNIYPSEIEKIQAINKKIDKIEKRNTQRAIKTSQIEQELKGYEEEIKTLDE